MHLTYIGPVLSSSARILLSLSILAMMPSRSRLAATERAGERLDEVTGRWMSLGRLVQSADADTVTVTVILRKSLNR